MFYLLIISLLLSPTLTIRFSIGGIPANILMVWILLLWLIFGINLVFKKQLSAFFKFVAKTDKKTLIPLLLFIFAGLLSVFIGGPDQKKLGQFIVLFLQPISLFFIGKFIFQQDPRAKTWFIYSLYFFLAAAGIYAIIQYFTLYGLPSYYWGNSIESKRAVSFFGHPDFYALFSAPLLAFLLPDVLALGVKSKKLIVKGLLWTIAATGLFLSLSRAGWFGLTAAVIIYAIVSKNKLVRRLIAAAAIVVIVIVAIVPNWRYRLITPFYGEKSASSRAQLWGYGITAIKQSPILGLGLNGFSKQWSALNTDPAQNSANFPHNIFLDLWVDLGLLGLISFVWLCVIYIKKSIINRSNESYFFPISLFLITLLLQGQFDNPYFRNDLAIVFWLILSLTI